MIQIRKFWGVERSAHPEHWTTYVTHTKKITTIHISIINCRIYPNLKKSACSVQLNFGLTIKKQQTSSLVAPPVLKLPSATHVYFPKINSHPLVRSLASDDAFNVYIICTWTVGRWFLSFFLFIFNLILIEGRVKHSIVNLRMHLKIRKKKNTCNS